MNANAHQVIQVVTFPVAEVAKLLDCHPNTIYYFVNTHKLDYIDEGRVGKRDLSIPASSIIRLSEEKIGEHQKKISDLKSVVSKLRGLGHHEI